jgi:signal transduction histidine kinase
VKITQKFLLFGLISSLAQAVIGYTLFIVLSKVETLAAQEAQQSEIARTLVVAVAKSVEVAIAASTYAATSFDEAGLRVDETTKQADKVYSNLLTLTRDDPTTHAEIEQFIQLGNDSKKEFLIYKGVTPAENIDNDSPVKNIQLGKLQYARRFMQHINSLNKILDRQNARLNQIRIEQQQQRPWVVRLVIIELIVGFVIIATLYIVFRYDFGRRFNNLLSIANDLALDRPPSKIVSGGDELSELSDALVTAADARREAVAQKQLLFQMVTHDLRSPLMAASLVVDTLLRDDKSTEEKKLNRLQSVERSLLRVVGLANDLLTVERLSAGGLEINRTRSDLWDTIENAIESVQPLAQQKQILLANNAPNLTVSIDEDRILQVIVNLVANAIKYSPSGQTVEISAAVDGNRLRVEVLDRGPGISEKDIKRLFNPFQQVSEGDKAIGFGLGLTIAKMLVELHEGKIGASARPGGGTIFWFNIRL